MSTLDAKKPASEDRDSNYRALVRDVILGSVAVIFLSLAVPAWIIRSEYRKTYRPPVKVAPAAEVLRERTSDTVVITPPAPDILELAERLVLEEAERREAERRAKAHPPITRSAIAPARSAAAPPTPVAAPAGNTPQFGSRESVQSP